jgi:hypothetical protein
LRDILTILAGIVILALTAALAVPAFVDWNGYRFGIEQQLSRALGAPVKIDGAIDLRLLPTPTLDLESVAVGPGDGPGVSAQSAHFEIGVMPLLRGQIEVLEARLERPRLDLSIDSLVAPDAGARAVRFERIVMRNAIVDLRMGERTLRLDRVDLDARAASLAGPFKGEGSTTREGLRRPFRFSTAEREGDRLRFKLVVDAVEERPRLEFDGALVAGGRLEGKAIIAGKIGETPWRVGGDVGADSAGARFDKIEARLGEEETLASASGDGEATFGASPRARLRLQARQLDLDRLAAAGVGPGAFGALPGGFGGATTLDLEARAEAATLGGETISGLRARLAAGAGQAPQVEISGAAPGRTHAELTLTAGEGLAGKVRVASEDWPRFAQWAGQVAPRAAGALRALPTRQTGISGDFRAREQIVEIDNLALTLGKTLYTGRAAFHGATTGKRALVEAQLSAPALDLDALPDLSALAAGDVDLSIGLDAQTVRVARSGQAPVAAGRIALALRRDAGGLRLDRLRLDDVAGAQIEARANLSRDGGRIEFSSAAQDLRAAAEALRRLAPGVLSEALARRAPALSPMRLAGAAEIARVGEALTPTELTVDGSAGGSRVSGRMTPAADGRLQARLVIEAANGATLLSQLGAPVFDATGVGAGRIEAQTLGRAGEPADARIDARIGEATLGFVGKLGLDLEHPRLDGAATLRSADLGPLLRGLMLDVSDPTARTPAELAGRAAYADGRLTFEGVVGVVDGARIAGGLTRDAKGALTGALKLDHLSLPWLAGLVLGPPQPARAGALWSELRFAPDALEPPPLRLAVEAAGVTLMPGLVGKDARATIEVAPGRLVLSDVGADVAGARVEGRVNLRRDGAEANVAGQARIAGLTLDLPSLKGRFSLNMDFAGGGASAAALIGSLAGGGGGEAVNLRLPLSDPAAGARVAEAAEAESIGVDEASVRRALERELDRAEMRLAATKLDVGLIGGALKLTAPAFEATLDLRTLALDQRNRVAGPPPAGWRGGFPPVDARFAGPMAAPRRTVDAGALTQALAGRAIAREQARIEAFEFDVRERQFFYRRLKSERAREAARVALEEAQRKAEDEARRKAEEAARVRAEASARARADEDARREAEAILRPSPSIPPRAPPNLPPPSAQKPTSQPPAPGQLY